MAEHAELQILEAARDLLSAPGISRHPIHLNRTTRFGESEELPAIILHYGEDEPVRQNIAHEDRRVELVAEFVVRAEDERAGQVLSAMRRDTHAALMTPPRNLGLGPMVIDVIPGTADEPEFDDDSARHIVRRRVGWFVHYRTLLTDATRHS